MRRVFRVVPVLLVALTLAWLEGRTPARAQAPAGGVDPGLFHGLEFRSAGPPRGGRSTTVTGVPSEPRTFYMGVASGGLFKTTDAGESWFPVTDGQVPLGSTGSVAVADSDPNVVYLGTGSDDVRSNVSTGRGVYKSTDAGKTWSFAGLRDAGQIGGVRISPTDPNTAWVAAQGNAFVDNPERGIFKTTDGGANWRKTLFVSNAIGAMDVELQPGNPQVVYAWMSHLQRKPWTIISGGPASDGAGFYKSTDGGEHFTKMTSGLPSDLIGKGNIAVTAANPNRVYALIEAKPGGGLYRSEDAGQTWAAINLNPEIITRPFYYDTLGADPTNADTIYLGDENWWKSTDGGKTLQPMRTPHGDNHDIWVSPKDGKVMIQSNDGGANVSTDGGETWSTQLNQPTAELYGVWMDDQFPYNLYAAQQDDSTEIMPMNADPLDSSSWRNAPGCETGPVMPKPNDPNIVYGACKGQFSVMDMRTGQERNYWVGAQSLYGNPASDLIYRFQRVSPMATSPLDPNVVYYGSQYLHKSTDLGVTWQTISPDLTAHPAGTQGVSGEPITRDVTGEEFYSTLYAITQAATEPGVIWTGSNDGPFYVTRDDGKTWTNVTPKDLPPGGRVQYIDASPFRKGSAYFAVYRYLLGDFQPYIYKTDDYGKTWTRLTDGKNGIPEDTPTRVVREDPNREGLLYAGTEFGLYISFDDGKHWQPFQLNLPQVPVTDIKVYHKDLVLTTQGRSFWILDDLSAVEQLEPRMMGQPISTSAPHLFAPRDGYRTQVSPNLLGPTFQYYLPEGTTGPVTLDVLDSAGAVVDSYSSSGAPAGGAGRGRAGRGGGGRGAGAGRGRGAGAAGGGGFFGRGRGGAVTRATADAGINKVVWDLRDKDGIELPPGKYQVRLTAGGASQTEPFTVLIDPRIAADGITVADLVEQYQHNARMHVLVTDINSLLSRVEAARQGATGDKAKALQDIYDQIIPTPEGVRYAKPGLQEQITYLAGMTTRVDQKVGRDALDRYQTLEKQFDDLKAQADKVLGG